MSLRELPRPALRADDDVILRVALAGLCRTDLYVADGLLRASDPVILGHELSGTIIAAGPAAHLRPGTRATVLPLCPCGDCPACASDPATCHRPTMLGVDRHGAFAEEVLVPAVCVFPLPDDLPDALGAYTEPVAAALAVTKVRLPPGPGVLYGNNRIAQLTARILALHGTTDLLCHDPAAGPLPPCAFAYAIETQATQASLAALLQALRPGGTLVLKSRPHAPVPLDVHLAVRKEITLQAVNYAPFPEAVQLLHSGRLHVADLLGPPRPLADFAAVFAAARAGEAAKLFLAPDA